MGLQIGGLIGLYGGATFGILGWWLGRRMAKKNRGLDELHDHIWQKARSISWYFTLAAIYILFSLVAFGIELSVAMVLGIMLLVHMSSWGITGMILSINMNRTEPLKPSKVKFGVAVMVLSLIFFAVLSIVTGNWWFLLVGIPPSVLGLISALSPEGTVEGKV
ncbi:hypothetical protein N0O92_16805 [Alkalihalobacillus sp. MEB130]|uniref:hypothetical protein n=1 Tax=Alkalihalobacillus sp. MEB130 TaxID=2976704 RepID=UPI0028DF12F0|nr:hypothetical protein [Alkalihalobacillus sp. MEB130]MDT8861875.1 hypothetical protein [Alkalihalobacillus sp. MEB130]